MPEPQDRPQRSRWRRTAARVGAGLLCLAGVVTLADLAGRAHWLLALAAHFRLQVAWDSLLAGCLLGAGGRGRWAAPAVILAAVLAWNLAPPATRSLPTAGSAARLRVLSLNVWIGNVDISRVIELIKSADPDVIVLIEVGPRWQTALGELKTRWPHAAWNTGAAHTGIALLSRVPGTTVDVRSFTDGIPYVTASFPWEGQRVDFAGVHLDRPNSRWGARAQHQQFEELSSWIAKCEGDAIIAGDFNATTWSAPLVDFLSRTGLGDSRAGYGIQPSWPSPLPWPLRIPIDHCLASAGLRVSGRRLGPGVGSDHLPVIVDFSRGDRVREERPNERW